MKTCVQGHEYTTLKCSVCAKAYNKANKEQTAAQQKAWQKANPKKVAANKKAWQEANNAHVAAYRKAWKDANPEKVKADRAKRRAAKLQQTPSWYNHEDAVAIYKELKPGYHVDHIVPLRGKNVSGLHWHHNLQILPEAENMAKNNKFNPDTYTHELPLY